MRFTIWTNAFRKQVREARAELLAVPAAHDGAQTAFPERLGVGFVALQFVRELGGVVGFGVDRQTFASFPAVVSYRSRPIGRQKSKSKQDMDLRSGHPYWLIRNGLCQSFEPLTKNARCDVAVIGAGITGALVAWHLIEAGFDTMVLDQRDAGWGSTAASTALLQYEIDTPLAKLSEHHGREHAVRAYLACRDAIYKLRDLTSRLPDACGFSLRPSIQVATNVKSVRAMVREFEMRSEHGFEVELLTAHDLKKQFGFDKPAALRTKDAAQVDPYRLTYELLTLGLAKTLRVHDRTRVVDYDLRKRSVTLRTDRGAAVRCKWVVFATGYEVTTILRREIVDLKSTFALVSEPVTYPLWQDECLFWEWADPYLYFRVADDCRIMVGGEDEPFHDAEKRDVLLGEKTKVLLRKFARYFPRLPLEVAFAWAGTFGETKDGLAYIGQIPDFPRAFFTLGFGGNGIVYSILAAELIRDRLLEVPNPYEGLFEFARDRVPPRGE